MLHTEAPLIPFPAVDSGRQSIPQREAKKPTPDSLTKMLSFERAKTVAAQRLMQDSRRRLDSCLSVTGLPHLFVAVKDTVLHRKDSIVINLLTGKVDFFHFGVQEEAATPGIGRISLFPAYRSIFDIDLTVWATGAPSVALKVWNPFRPVWWVPGEVGIAAKADGNKGITLGWPIP